MSSETLNGAAMAVLRSKLDGIVRKMSNTLLRTGIDPRSGKAFVNQVFLAMSGGAASPTSDAWWTIGHVGNAGLCCIDGVELAELYQPIIVYGHAFVADSEGAGRTTGVPPPWWNSDPLGAIDIGYLSDGHVNAPAGVRGGMAGGGTDQYLIEVDGTLARLDACRFASRMGSASSPSPAAAAMARQPRARRSWWRKTSPPG